MKEERRRLPSLLFFGVWFFDIGTAQQVVHADMVEVGQFHQGIHGIVESADLILGVCVLFDIQIVRDLLLRMFSNGKTS